MTALVLHCAVPALILRPSRKEFVDFMEGALLDVPGK